MERVVHVAKDTRIADLSADRTVLTVTGLPDGVTADEIKSLGDPVSIEVDADEATATITLSRPLGPWALLGGPFQANVRGRRILVADALRDRERVTVVAQGAPSGSSGIQEEGRSGTPTGAAFSPLSVPVGTRSVDDSAIVGQGGHLFIARGSNNLERQYAEPQGRAERARIKQQAKEWASLFAARNKKIAALGARYVQAVQPEKASMLDTGVRGLGGGVTPLYAELERRVGRQPWFAGVRAALDEGAHTGMGVEENWIPFDSHPSPRGMARVLRAIVSRFADTAAFDEMTFAKATTHAGDLSGKFFGNWVRQPIVTSSAPWLDVEPELVERGTTRPDHAFVGTKMVWRAPEAPLPLKVVLFGSSTFSSAPKLQRSGNRVFSHLFREYHFRWESELDLDYIAEVRPDVVICHTTERFLTRLPRV